MSIMSSVCAEHHRGIVSNEISLLKAKLSTDNARKYSPLEVAQLLGQLEDTINSQIDE